MSKTEWTLREDIQNWLNDGRGGYYRAATYLAPLLDEVDDETLKLIYSEGNIIANRTGMRFADGIYEAVRAYQSGRRDFPHVEANRRMLEEERRMREAGHANYVMPMEQVFKDC